MFGGAAAEPSTSEATYFPRGNPAEEAITLNIDMIQKEEILLNQEAPGKIEYNINTEKTLPAKETTASLPTQRRALRAARASPSPASETPDYNGADGAPTIYMIETKEELLEKVLNTVGERETHNGSRDGNRINKTTFVLADNFTIYASELDDTYFKTQYHTGAQTLYSSIDGNDKTITVIVDTEEPSRPLFNNIGSDSALGQYVTKYDRLFIKDLTVKYVGDPQKGTEGNVKVSSFANSNIIHCDLENIKIEVEGDIAGDFRWPADTRAHAYGFAQDIDSLLKRYDDGTVMTNENGIYLYYPLIVKDISVTAKTFGYSEGNSPIGGINTLGLACGFALNTPAQTTLENITVNYDRIDATSSDQMTLYGFSYIRGKADDIHVNVNDIYVRTQQNKTYGGWSGSTIHGIGNASHLSNSSLNVANDIIIEYEEVEGSVDSYNSDIIFCGIGELNIQSWSDNGRCVNLSNNSVNIGGNLTAKAPGSVYMYGLIGNSQSMYSGTPMVIADNKLSIGGNLEIDTTKKERNNNYRSQVLLVGMFDGINNGENNTLSVGKNMTAHCENGSAWVFGHFCNLGGYVSNINNSTTDIGGVLKATSDNGSANIFGMNYGDIKESSGNKVIVRNKAGEPEGMYAETKALGKAAKIEGYGVSANTSVASVTNNTVYVNGNMTAKAPEKAIVTGMTYHFYAPMAGSVISDNIIRVDGKMQSIADDTTNGFAYATGFVTLANQTIMNNAVYARDGIWTDVGISADNEYAAGFALEAADESQIYNNTWLDRPGEFVQETPSAARADYTKFIIAPLNSNTGGNFYTSVLGGQRVSNEIVYDAQDNQYALVSKEKQPLLEVSSETNFAAAQPYIIRSEVEALTFAGTGASKAVLSDGELTLPADSFVMLTAAENAKRAVKDISGIGHVNTAGRISGNIFVDVNDDGIYNSGDEAAAITVRAYYLEEEIASNQTSADGSYTILIPLMTADDPTITLKMEIPAGYQISSSDNNDFTAQNELETPFYWTESVSGLNGILILSGERYTVTFDSMGGSDVDPIENVISGETIIEPAKPSKTDAEFGGWYKEQAIENAWDFTTDTVTNDMTLYAKWITIEDGGGDDDGDDGNDGGSDTGNATVVDRNTPQNTTANGGAPKNTTVNSGENTTVGNGTATQPVIPGYGIENNFMLFFPLAISIFLYRNKKEQE